MGPEHDIRCSKSCTRASIAVLALAALAISFLHPLEKTRALQDLVTYTSLRVYMKEELDQLESDRAWNRLKKEVGSPLQTWSIARLLETKVKLRYPEEPSGSVSKKRPEPQTSVTQMKSKELRPPLAPAAPANLGVEIEQPILPIHAIAEALSELADPEMIDRARTYSQRYNFSIYFWQTLWHRMQVENPVITFSGEIPKSISSSVLTLTLPNLALLVNYNLPTIVEVDALYKERASVTIPSFGIPIGLLSATLFVEMGLVLSVFYFWIWYKEATVSENFPAAGTLFGALARSLLSRSMFLFLIAVAPIASVFLAIKSNWSKPENIVFAGFVVFLALVVLKDAWQLIFGVPRPFFISTIRGLLSRRPFSRIRSREVLAPDGPIANSRADIERDGDTGRGRNKSSS